ncbi:hypothetical protein E2320_007055, partial [Naja naja]
MPQLQPAAAAAGGGGAGGSSSSGAGSSSDDLGAPDELIAFQDEGDEQDKGAGGRGSAHGDLDELKSSLVHESENRGGSASGSDSEVKAGGRRRGEARGAAGEGAEMGGLMGGEIRRGRFWPRRLNPFSLCLPPDPPLPPQSERPPQPPRESFQKPRDSAAEVIRRQQDGGFFKGTPYPSYPFLMIPELGSPYLPSGALSPSGART